MSALKKSDIEIEWPNIEDSSFARIEPAIDSWLRTYTHLKNKHSLDEQVVETQSKLILPDDNKAEARFSDLLSMYLESQQNVEQPETSKVLQKWECVVKSFDDKVILASAHDLVETNSATEEIEIDLESIPEADRELISKGAVFYWHIGYFKNSKGTVVRGSSFRFRRLPAWTKREIEDADVQAEELSKLFAK